MIPGLAHLVTIFEGLNIQGEEYLFVNVRHIKQFVEIALSHGLLFSIFVEEKSVNSLFLLRLSTLMTILGARWLQKMGFVWPDEENGKENWPLILLAAK